MRDWTTAWTGAVAFGITTWTRDPRLFGDRRLAQVFVESLASTCAREGVDLLAHAVRPGAVHAILARGPVPPTLPFRAAKAATTRALRLAGRPDRTAWRTRVRVLSLGADALSRLCAALDQCRVRLTGVNES